MTTYLINTIFTLRIRCIQVTWAPTQDSYTQHSFEDKGLLSGTLYEKISHQREIKVQCHRYTMLSGNGTE